MLPLPKDGPDPQSSSTDQTSIASPSLSSSTDHTSTASPSHSSNSDQTPAASPSDNCRTTPHSTFPCIHSGCGRFFNSQPDLRRHIARHTRPYKCSVVSCSYNHTGFGAHKELRRHEDSIHRNRGLCRIVCPDHRCKFSRPEKAVPITRRDNFLRHVESQHPELHDWTRQNLHKLQVRLDKNRLPEVPH